MILARQAIGAGIYDIVLIVGVQKMGKGVLGPEILDLPETDRIQRKMGLLSLPSKYAMIARRHMEEHGATVEQLAQVSVKNHNMGRSTHILTPEGIDAGRGARLAHDFRPLDALPVCPYRRWCGSLGPMR